MTRKSMENIIAKYINNEASNAEMNDLVIWLENKQNRKVFKDYLSINEALNQDLVFDSIKAYQKTLKISTRKEIVKPLISPRIYKYIAAASILLIIGVSVFFQQDNPSTNPENAPIIVDNNIKIGSDKAILTTEDGKNIVLEKGIIYNEKDVHSDGEKIIYSDSIKTDKSKIEYNYITIPRGGQFYVELSDNTKIWLNSESKIKYPKVFLPHQTREVELVYGEAYFDVSPSKDHSGTTFKVKHKVQDIEVLGTEFNIKAYQDEDAIYTTLVEGEVAVNNEFSQEVLIPNQQSIIKAGIPKIGIREVQIKSEIGWINGEFIFKEKSLKDIMTVLSRWYDMDVVFLNKELENVLFTGTVYKNQNVEEILLLIKITNVINSFEINNKTIKIK